MTFNAPAPRLLVAWLAEDREVIKFRVARRAFALFDVFEHLVEAHDRDGFDVALLTHAAGKQRLGESSLSGGHVFNREAFAGLGDEVPVEALLVVKLVAGRGLLL